MATSSTQANSLTVDEKIQLIERGLQEQLKPEIIHDILRKNERPPVIYWGTATTGKPHCAYFVPMVKLAEFLRAGCVVKILLADLHAVLDNLKAPLELVKFRAEYYRRTLMASLKAINVPVDRIEFVLGTSYQLTEKYSLDFHRLSCLVSERNAKKATTQVLKEVSDPPVSGLNYPLMQALDEEYLGVDAQFGGIDQRKIFTLALEQLPKIGYRKRAHLMNPMIPGLQGGKMSSSEPDSKIDFLDSPDVVKKKMRKIHLVPRETENSGIFSYIQYVLLPVSQLQRNETPEFAVEQREGEFRIYNDIETLKDDYREDKVSPEALRTAVTMALISLLRPIQAEYAASQEWQDAELQAYPPPLKKEKKQTDKGSRHPKIRPSEPANQGPTAEAESQAEAVKVEGLPDGSVRGEGQEKVNVGASLHDAMSGLDMKET